MKTLVSFLPALACGAMMLVCARMMFGRHEKMNDDSGSRAVAELHEEIARLRGERALGEREEKIDG